jgi:hypothetical protein
VIEPPALPAVLTPDFTEQVVFLLCEALYTRFALVTNPMKRFTSTGRRSWRIRFSAEGGTSFFSISTDHLASFIIPVLYCKIGLPYGRRPPGGEGLDGPSGNPTICGDPLRAFGPSLHLTLGPSPGPSRRSADPCAWKAGSREDRAKGGPGKIQGIGQSAGNLGPRADPRPSRRATRPSGARGRARRAQGRGFPWSKQAPPTETKALVGSGEGEGLCLSHSYKLIVYRGTIK